MTPSQAKELFQKISVGDVPAYEEVFNQWFDRLYTTALIYVKSRDFALDVVQQVFLKLWERRSILADVQDPEAWLHSASRYQALHHLKKETQQSDFLAKMPPGLLADNNTPDAEFSRGQQHAIIDQALNVLTTKQREIYQLSREEGLTYAEIAERLGLARETIKDYMGQALKKLKEFLMENKHEFLPLFLFFPNFF